MDPKPALKDVTAPAHIPWEPPVVLAERRAFRTTELALEGGARVVLDPSQWRCRLLRDLDGHRALIIDGADLRLLRPEAARSAAVFALDSALGAAERQARYDEVLIEPLDHRLSVRFTELR